MELRRLRGRESKAGGLIWNTIAADGEGEGEDGMVETGGGGGGGGNLRTGKDMTRTQSSRDRNWEESGKNEWLGWSFCGGMGGLEAGKGWFEGVRR